MYASWTSRFGWGVLTSLSTCLRHVCLVNFGVWAGAGGMLTSLSTCSHHVCFVNFGVWVGGGGHVNVPVHLLTSCMLRELRGLGGGDVDVPVNLHTSCMPCELRGLGGGMLTSLSTCSRHVCFVNFGVWVGADVNVPVNLLTSCRLREPRGLGGGMLTSLSTCSRHVMYASWTSGFGWGGCYRPCQLAHVMYASWTSDWGPLHAMAVASFNDWKKSLMPLQFLKQVAKACNARW